MSRMFDDLRDAVAILFLVLCLSIIFFVSFRATRSVESEALSAYCEQVRDLLRCEEQGDE